MKQSTISLKIPQTSENIGIWERYRSLIPFFIGSLTLPFSVFPFFIGWDSCKWVVLYGLTALSLLWVPRHFQFYFPKLSPYQKVLLLCIFLVLFFNFFFHNLDFFGQDFTDRLLFWALFFYFCFALKFCDVADKKLLYVPLFFGTGVFIIYAFVDCLARESTLAFTFFNINKAAEFVGFSLALQLGLFMCYSGKAKKVLSLLIIISITYLYFAKSRSVFLGGIFMVAYLLLAQKINLKSMFYISFGAILCIFSIEHISSSMKILPTQQTSLPQAQELSLVSTEEILKEGSSSERWKKTTPLLQLLI